MKAIGIILFGILLINASFKPTSQSATVKVYDYITIVVEHSASDKPKIVTISTNGEKYEQTNIKDKARGEFDNNEVIKILNKYEKEGYELFENNFTPTISGNSGNRGTNYFLIRREHKN